MTSWLPCGIGTTTYSEKAEEQAWNGYELVDKQLEFQHGTSLKYLTSLKSQPDAMYDRLNQNKYEDKIKQEFKKRRFEKSKTLGKRQQ